MRLADLGIFPTETQALPPLARWASFLFTLSVLTILISIAASQALLAASSLCFALHLWRNRPALRFPPVLIPLLLFCLATVLSVLWAPNSAVGWFAVRKLVLFLILLLAANLLVSARHLEWIYRGLFLEAAVAGVVAAVQFVWRYQQVHITHPEQVYYQMAFEQRVQGFQGHWMAFSGQQMLVFAALLACLLLASRRRPLWWVVCAIITASIVLGLTRGVWLGCLVASVYLLWRWKPRALWVLPALLVVAALAAPSLVLQRVTTALRPSKEPALSIRFEMWQVGLNMIRAHPWLGVGPNNVEQVYPLYVPDGRPPQIGYHGHLHNNFIHLAAERGLPALAAWIWFMAALGWRFWKIRGRLKASRWVAEGALAGWLAFLTEGFFEFNFGSSPVLMLFLFVASSPFLAERFEREQDIPGPGPSQRRHGEHGDKTPPLLTADDGEPQSQDSPEAPEPGRGASRS